MVNRLNKKNQGYAHFIKHEGAFSPRIPDETAKKILPGIYRLGLDEKNNVYFLPMSAMTDQLVTLPDSVSERITQEVANFWTEEMRKKFDSYGLVYKRGILLYGKPGTGKTCTIARIMENVTNDGGIVLFNPDPKLMAVAMERLREIQANIKVLVVFEEFEDLCHEPSFKSLLDGELQVENVVYIATTNYIDLVPANIKNRPSRFATVIEVGVPSLEARRTYLENKLKLEDQANLEEWLKVTKGMVIDQIKDLIVSVCCLGLTLKEASTKIREMGDLVEAPGLFDKVEQRATVPVRLAKATLG